MSAIAIGREYVATPREVTETTLLELVRAVSEVCRDEREIVAVVVDLLESGQARLVGNFAGVPAEVFQAAVRD